MRLLICYGLTLWFAMSSVTTSHAEPLSSSWVHQAAEISQQAAHWVSPTQVLLAPDAPKSGWILYPRDNPNAAVKLSLSANAAPVKEGYWHLAKWQSFKNSLPIPTIKQWLKSGVYVFHPATGDRQLVQTGWLLDALYTEGKQDANEYQGFGATPHETGVTFAVWAPTAQEMSVVLYHPDKQLKKTLPLKWNRTSGIWSLTTTEASHLDFYQYRAKVFHPSIQRVVTVTTTDPYSLSLSTNSRHSQVVDLNANYSKPKGWDQQRRPALERPEQHIIYEMHVGDFSGTDESIPASLRGTYEAFQTQSNGVKHLTSLTNAGINTAHLLPVFDIGTVNEDVNQRIALHDPMRKVCALAKHVLNCTQFNPDQTLLSLLNSYSPDSAKAQALLEIIRPFDDYNWGYDPFHYTVPEGSYSQTPDGIARIIAFRDMVKTLHNLGLRVVMDVVYNHTHASGLRKQSVLDKLVPNYYHRLHPMTGQIEQSTCCDNTATERVMMGKLMTDSLLVWTRAYAIDGFRFDLMGHQPKSLMLAAREQVTAIDPDNYFYGEGWNFGEVANNQRFTQASQLNLGGTEIGTFSDRLRDAVRGPNFNISGDTIRKSQGIGNGILMAANESSPSDAEAQHSHQWLLLMLGLGGNLSDFQWHYNGQEYQGDAITYGYDMAGYANDPADTIHYVSKHDNQTLWDNHQYRLPLTMDKISRLKLHLQSLTFPLIAQGIPFIHMGSELARSKSFLRDSYDYGHWFNQVDFAYQTNNFHVGLPPAVKDEVNWPVVRKVVAGASSEVRLNSSDIQWLNQGFKVWLTIRNSSPLFSLPTKDTIQQAVSVDSHPNTAGAATLTLDDSQLNLDQNYEKVAVLINTSASPVTFNLKGMWQLHPAHHSMDASQVQTLKVNTKNSQLTVPSFTNLAVVLEE